MGSLGGGFIRGWVHFQPSCTTHARPPAQAHTHTRCTTRTNTQARSRARTLARVRAGVSVRAFARAGVCGGDEGGGVDSRRRARAPCPRSARPPRASGPSPAAHFSRPTPSSLRTGLTCHAMLAERPSLLPHSAGRATVTCHTVLVESPIHELHVSLFPHRPRNEPPPPAHQTPHTRARHAFHLSS